MFFRILLPLLLLAVTFESFSQKEANIWYFGNNAGLSFSTFPPTPLTDGKINTREGVSNICDKNGNLLFYSEGTQVWDATHQLMPNGIGLKGDYSSTQSSIAIPNPGNPNRYFLFTTALSNGTFYSEIDMTLNAGKGDVVAATKNTELIPAGHSSSEKLIATRHCNGKDYWVLTHLLNSSTFRVYLVTAAGVQPPLNYNVGSALGDNDYWEGTSYLKLSADGSRLVNVIGNPSLSLKGKVEILNFNNQTGAITGPVIQLTSGFDQPYGAEFSSDNRLLYVSANLNKTLYQFDLTAANVPASQFVIATTNLNYGALQMGPDGKIYVAAENGYQVGYNYLGVINNPNVKGAGCNYVKDGIQLGGKKALIGLPTYVSTFFKDTSGFTVKDNCASAATSFSIIYTGNIDSVKWNFGDASAISTVQSPTHVFPSFGNYNVQLIVYRKCSVNDTVTRTIRINPITSNVAGASICPGGKFVLPNGTEVTTAGNYPVTLKSSAGCDSIVNYIVTVLPAPVVNLGPDTAICSNTTLQLNPGVHASYLWQNNSTGPTLTAAATGLYWVEVKSANGCTKRDSINVTVKPALTFTLGKDSTLCSGQTLTLGANVAGATSYVWNTGATTAQISTTTGGIFWQDITAANGCKTRDSITATFGVTPAFSLGNDTALCSGQSVSLAPAVTGASSYVWNTGATTNQITVNAAGLYWLETQGTLGCKKRDTLNVTIKPLPAFNLGKDTLLCDGQTITLGSSIAGATAYLWNTGASSSQITTSVGGTYWQDVTGANGCVGRDSIVVLLGVTPTFTLGKDTAICAGQSLNLAPLTLGASGYLWSNGSVSNQITVNTDGIYWLEAVAASGCKKRDTIIVTTKPLPVVDLGKDTIVCNAGPLTLGGTIAGVSNYLWNNGATTAQISANTSGLYWFEVTSTNGCAKRDTINIKLSPPPAFTLGNDTAVCAGQNLVLSPAVTGGVTSYLWSTGSSGTQITINTDGIYWLETQNADGCKKRDTIVFATKALPVVNLGKDSVVCGPATAVFGSTVPGASGYLWNTGATTAQITTNASGVYWVEVTGINGCKKSDTVQFTINPLPVVALGIDTAVCADKTLTIGGAIPGVTNYVWNTGASTPQITVNTAGVYWLEATDAKGCKKSDTIQFSLNPLPVVLLGKDTAICKGQLVTLGGAIPGVTSYLWSNTATTPQIITGIAGDFWLKVTDINGCSAADTVHVSENPSNDFELGNIDKVCEGDTVVLGKDLTGATYLWSTGEVSSQIEVTNPGQYWVRVRIDGCEVSDTVQFSSAPLPVLTVDKSNDIDCTRPIARLTASGATDYLWTPSIGLTAPTSAVTDVKITGTTTFTLKGTSADGCSDTTTVEVVVAAVGGQRYVLPNAFTPNGDGHNDCFGVSRWGALESLDLAIYNRWGERIYHTTNPNSCWDGTYKGKRQDPGGFVYVVKAKAMCGEINLKGIVMLIR